MNCFIKEGKAMNRQTRELNKINNELDKQLNAENENVMTDIVCYLRGANISEYNQELIRQDLLEMFLSAQKRGENIQKVICFSIAGMIAILTPIYWIGRATFFTVNIFAVRAIVLVLYIAHRLIAA
jgi:DNA-binding ferritin-like protein (Dps family)